MMHKFKRRLVSKGFILQFWFILILIYFIWVGKNTNQSDQGTISRYNQAVILPIPRLRSQACDQDRIWLIQTVRK